ncbi:hypothetical protein [Corynebacterium lowii]|uniref:Uncharacterized protein n=1 Tax=Corynebacterium lowii TaxID=1544413 RepID=A0A0Q1AK70_9CORY|nr:hypothetical protein [Corynebacterium lowii]KQB87334.1 hypothetical protein Clow_00389 [Corynebacterium lowii]MDP9852077.1 hypothetical protein [Corynebacterium lowii]
MGRLILILLIIIALVLLWKAFGPKTWNRGTALNRLNRVPQQPVIKGPDDDPDFLWNIDKQRFKERRAREQAEEARQQEEQRRTQRRDVQNPSEQSSGEQKPAEDAQGSEEEPEPPEN